LEAPDLGDEDGVMPKEMVNGKPTKHRYSEEEKTAAVRMIRTLRAELGVTQGTVQGTLTAEALPASRSRSRRKDTTG
jgi:hypothetical protein